ncbi:hypothetical protein D3C73_1109210 [compost metagenome]
MPRHQHAGAVVGAVGEGFEPQGHAVFLAQLLRGAVVAGGHQHQGQRRVVGRNSLQHRTQLRRVGHHVVVHRAVGFDVAHPSALRPAQAIKSANLVMQDVLQFLRGVGHGTSAEPHQILIGRMRTDLHAVTQRQADGLAHDARVAGVETAGNVGAIDEGHDLGVQTHGPVAETLADIAVQ